MATTDRFVLISGCSGGGKSTLLAALAAEGHATVPEPGRRIVESERARGGRALPWIDPEAFARRAVALALADRRAARGHSGRVFFDRGLIDAAAALDHVAGTAALAEFRRLERVFPALGYDIVLLPKAGVAERVAFVLATLASAPHPRRP